MGLKECKQCMQKDQTIRSLQADLYIQKSLNANGVSLWEYRTLEKKLSDCEMMLNSTNIQLQYVRWQLDVYQKITGTQDTPAQQ